MTRIENSTGGLASAGDAQAQGALREYECTRVALAAADGRLAPAARAISAAADAVAADAPADARARPSAIDAEGEQERSLAQGPQAFDYGMAEGYRIQPSADTSNPSLGTRMPGCAVPSNMEAG